MFRDQEILSVEIVYKKNTGTCMPSPEEGRQCVMDRQTGNGAVIPIVPAYLCGRHKTVLKRSSSATIKEWILTY